ncbi:uncharacterized protein LJ206_003433 isoform 2-T2 [Theristicus caerulescens]
MAKSDGLLFKYRSPMSPYSLQSHGWWCGTDGARVTSRLFSGPCKQSRPMTCSIMPFEEEASSVTTKKNQGVPLLTIGSSSWLQRGVQLPFRSAVGPCLLPRELQSCWGMVQTVRCGSVLGGSLKEEQSRMGRLLCSLLLLGYPIHS